MRKIILFALCNTFAISALPAHQPRACEVVEYSLRQEFQNLNIGMSGQTVGDHVHAARLYGSMARRGCPENFHFHRDMHHASLQVARALVESSGFDNTTQNRYNSMISTTLRNGF